MGLYRTSKNKANLVCWYTRTDLVNDCMSARAFSRIPAWLVLMGLITALGPLAIDMYLPAFPAMADDLGVSVVKIERTLAAYLLGLAFAPLVYGPLIDRFGRRVPLLAGLTLFLLASVGVCLSTNITDLTLWRVVQAFGGAVGMVVPRAVVRDQLSTQESARALSLLMMIMGVMPILAPLLGAQLLWLWNWRGIFVLMTASAALLIVGVLRLMRETLKPEHVTSLRPAVILRSYRQLLGDRQFLGYALAGAFGTAGLFSYIAGSPRVFIGLFHVDPSVFGWLFGVNSTALILAAQVSARLLARHSPARLLRRAQMVQLGFAVLSVLLTVTHTLTLPWLMLCLIGFMASYGFANPNAAALSLDRQGHRLGVASALMGTVHMLCGALAGWGVSAWAADDALPLTGILALCSALAWGFGRGALRREGLAQP